MKYGKLLVVLVSLSAIFLFSCSSSKTTNPENKFWEELENADYIVGLIMDLYVDGVSTPVVITYYSDNPTYPQATMRINNELVNIEWSFMNGGQWRGLVRGQLDFKEGDDVKILLSTPERTSNQTIRIPHKPQITNTDFPPIAHTDFNLTWQLNQNADLQIVYADGAVMYGEQSHYYEVINRSHRSHIIPGSTFPVNMIAWLVEIRNIEFESSVNHFFYSENVDIRSSVSFNDLRQQDLHSRFNEIYQILKNQ